MNYMIVICASRVDRLSAASSSTIGLGSGSAQLGPPARPRPTGGPAAVGSAPRPHGAECGRARTLERSPVRRAARAEGRDGSGGRHWCTARRRRAAESHGERARARCSRARSGSGAARAAARSGAQRLSAALRAGVSPRSELQSETSVRLPTRHSSARSITYGFI